MPYLGLVGFAGSGKDTVADILCEEYGYDRIAFADPLRRILMRLDPNVPYYDTTGYGPYSSYVRRVGYERAKKNPHVRQLLQRLGTECGREVLGEDVWVNHALDRADELGDQGQFNIAFTDCRFDNEVEAIRDREGYIILVNRPGVEAPNHHGSEELPSKVKADFTICNDSGLEELAEQVTEIITTLRAEADYRGDSG